MILTIILTIYIGIGIVLGIIFFSMEEGKELYRNNRNKVEGGKKEKAIFDIGLILCFVLLLPIMVLTDFIKK